MMVNQEFGDDNNTGSELINSSEDEPTIVSPLLKKQLEVIVIQTFHQVIKPILEPLIRRVVKEEIESARETILSSMERNEIHLTESRILQLRFLNKLSLPVLTSKRIQGDACNSIKVALIDSFTGKIVNSGPESCGKVEIVVLEGDLNIGEGSDWTIEEFNEKIVREREGKKTLLIGDAYLNMKEGVGTVGEISFTHNSSWMKNEKFRLGARVVPHIFSGTRVREAISEPFILKDRRSSLYEKRFPPSLLDEVWRLKKIAKDGPFHNRLSEENITTVKDFLTLFFINPQRLYDILGAGTKMVEIMINHAQTCILDKTVYLYRRSSQQKNGVVFNVVGQLIGLLLEGQYVPINTLSKTEKADAQNLFDSAFEHREDFFIEKKHQEDFVSFDDITSLMDACSETCPTNSPRLENPCGHDSGICHIFNGNDDTQPSTSSPGIVSSIHSIGEMVTVDGGLLTIAGMDFIVEQPLSDPGEVPSSRDFNPLSMIKDFDEGLLFPNNDHNPQPENLAVELPAAEQSATSSSRLVCATDVDQVEIRWVKLFSVLQCVVKIRSIVRSNHVWKKQRCC